MGLLSGASFHRPLLGFPPPRRAIAAIFVWVSVPVLAACGPGEPAPRCGDGTCDASENASTCSADCPASCGDGLCTPPGETAASCPGDCDTVETCAVLADVTEHIGAASVFFGYPALGLDASPPGCGDLEGGRTVFLSFTPNLTGDITLSTAHPPTTARTVLEVRQGSCDGPPVGCADGTAAAHTTLTVGVTAGETYVAAVAALPTQGTTFALSLHRAGVCEDPAGATDITESLMTGEQYAADTAGGVSSLAGSCGGAGRPEARYRFTAPRSGSLVITTEHPGTTFDTVLHLGEQWEGLGDFCGSPEVEVACNDDGAGLGSARSLLQLEVIEGNAYDLFVDGKGEPGEGQATLTVGYLAPSPAAASLRGCDHDAIQDRFAFFAASGETVHAMADTVDEATAADLRLMIRHPDGTALHEADDDVACTYPPPSYSCPEHTFVAPASGLYLLEVYVGSTEACADRGLVGYELTVTRDDGHADLILFGDD